MKNVYASNGSSISYGDYTLRLSSEIRSFFPDADQILDRNEIVMKAIDVNRSMAQEILDLHNNVNRPEKKGAQIKYAKAFDIGQWYKTHQGLAFGLIENSDGDIVHELFDGQNRLAALLLSSKESEQFLVFFGFQNSFQIMNSIDAGKNRDHSDTLVVLMKAGKLLLDDGVTQAMKHSRNAASFLKSFYHGTAKKASQLEKVELQGLAIAAKKVLHKSEGWRSICTNIKRAEVFGMCGRAFYAYEGSNPRIEKFLAISDNEMEYPSRSAKPADRWAYVFRAWYQKALPTAEATDKLLATIGRDAKARSLVSRVCEICLVNFLEENANYKGFAAYIKTGSTSSLRFKSLERSNADRLERLHFPKGVANLAASETKKLLDTVAYELV